MSLKDGEACDHPGCLSHVSHPCEGCGRRSGKDPVSLDSLHGRGIYFDMWGDCVKVDGELTLADLKTLVAYIEYYGYKDE